MSKNEKYYEIFEKSLQDAGLSKKTIGKHLDNIRLYLDEFISMHLGGGIEEGADPINMDAFFGDFYARKCCSSTAELKAAIGSIKRFYKCMKESGYLSDGAYKDFTASLKEYKGMWIEMFECM